MKFGFEFVDLDYCALWNLVSTEEIKDKFISLIGVVNVLRNRAHYEFYKVTNLNNFLLLSSLL